jgi:hypothetical protein
MLRPRVVENSRCGFLIRNKLVPLLTTVMVRDGCPTFPPDFLSRLVALTNFMRLSSLKAAHVDVGECSVQEIRVAPAYVGRKRWGEAPTMAFSFAGRANTSLARKLTGAIG